MLNLKQIVGATDIFQMWAIADTARTPQKAGTIMPLIKKLYNLITVKQRMLPEAKRVHGAQNPTTQAIH